MRQNRRREKFDARKLWHCLQTNKTTFHRFSINDFDDFDITQCPLCAFDFVHCIFCLKSSIFDNTCNRVPPSRQASPYHHDAKYSVWSCSRSLNWIFFFFFLIFLFLRGNKFANSSYVISIEWMILAIYNLIERIIN